MEGKSRMRPRLSIVRPSTAHPVAAAAPRRVVVRAQPSLRLITSGADERGAYARAFDTLNVAYQPIVRVSVGSIVGWQAEVCSPEPALESPLAIFAAAERHGRTLELSRWLLGEGPRVLDRHDASVSVFFALHPRGLFDASLTERLFAEPNAARIVLVLSERDHLAELHAARAQIDAARSSGARFAIEGLGAGCGGLAGFAALEPEVVKLDPSLLRGLDRSADKRGIIRALVSVCADLGVLSVADGVETRAEAELLGELGVDHQQGRYHTDSIA